MCSAYTTSEEHLPADTEGEVTLQVTDTESREIFRTRARIARDPATLDDPAPLTVVKGPHENTEEQWYIEIIAADAAGVDADLLRECIREVEDGSDLLNARSAELRALLTYLVRTGAYESISAAVRDLLSAKLAAEFPALIDQYVEERTAIERAAVADAFGRSDG